MNWPADADGDVMRRLKNGGFNFDQEVEIDFNIDFDIWPPDSTVTGHLESHLPSAIVSVQDDYVLVQVRGHLTYPFVVKMQRDLTEISAKFGGRCESWGVLSGQG